MKVAVIGAGYVGLVSGACFSDFGHQVVCVDRDAAKIRRLTTGEIPIFEPGLETLVERNVRAGRLAFSAALGPAVKSADVVFIAVGTPSRRGDGFADLRYVFDAARDIAAEIEAYTVVVMKSTVPVGTGDKVEQLIRETRPDADVDVVSNPEFLREGAAIEDFKRPDRIVVGTDSERARHVMAELYRPLFLNETPILYTSRRTSELIKYAANAFLAMKITFINETADLCEALGADVQDVARGIGLDRRIGAKFLHPGPGYGGSCFPKDTLALVRTAEGAGAPFRLVETVVAVNEKRKQSMAARILAACGGAAFGKRIAILGLTFKPNTDDLRDAPSMTIIPALLAAGAEVTAFDPEGMPEARRLIPALQTAVDSYGCAENADVLVIMTEWDQFRALDLGRIGRAMRTPVLLDLRNIYKPHEVTSHGLRYLSVGRLPAEPADGESGSARSRRLVRSAQQRAKQPT